MTSLDGVVAIITGGAQGQGESHARLLVQRGARVALTDVNVEAGIRVADDLGDAAVFIQHDVVSEDDWARVVAETEARFGPVNVLVNNAGIDVLRSVEETTLEQYRRVIDINQVGTFLGIREVVGSMRRAGGGSIINISSIGGIHTKAKLRIAYVASKFAVRGMTKAAAVEYAEFGVRVNSIHPGFVNTEMFKAANVPPERVKEMVPMGRPAELREISELVAFLASDASSYITGSEHLIDGGYSGGF